MTTLVHRESDLPGERASTYAGPAYQAYRILQVGFVAAPIIAGLDKFFDRLADWDKYLAPQTASMLGGNAHGFMLIVGIVEIVAGIGVALKPKYFGYVVAAWLVGIIVNLLLHGTYYDIALRDLGLCLGAVALARLAALYDQGPAGGLLTRSRR